MRPGYFGNLGDTWFGELGRHGNKERGHHGRGPKNENHPGKHKGWEKGQRRKGWKRWKKGHKAEIELMKKEGPCAFLKGHQQRRCMKQLWRAYKEAKIQAAAPSGPLSGFFGFFGL